MRPCDECLRKMLKLVQLMHRLADEGDAVREDTNCGVLYSVLRDAAYHVGHLAEREKEAHIKKGWWE